MRELYPIYIQFRDRSIKGDVHKYTGHHYLVFFSDDETMREFGRCTTFDTDLKKIR